ncbi:MAG: hypothetical protein B6230_05360 [Desulfobacteraceae bacterium 4572_89]|nr:MAG: hypothetical protein B6230_05360 [Desulfobacteraceae bacterium 4572_89]
MLGFFGQSQGSPCDQNIHTRARWGKLLLVPVCTVQGGRQTRNIDAVSLARACVLKQHWQLEFFTGKKYPSRL